MVSSDVRVMTVGDGVAVAGIGNVCAVIWRSPVTRPRFEAQLQGLRDVTRAHPDGAGFLCIIEPTAKPPDDALRRAAAKMIRDHEDALRGIACVVEGTGFVSAITRSALSAMALLIGRRKAPLHVAGEVDAAARWLAPRTSGLDAARLAQEVSSLRARLEPYQADPPG